MVLTGLGWCGWSASIDRALGWAGRMRLGERGAPPGGPPLPL